MRPREHRHEVFIKARMLHDHLWTEVVVRNVSSRGMLLQHPNPPARGKYIEVRRATQVIVARVIWSRGQNFGVRSQDTIDLKFLTAEDSASLIQKSEGGVAHDVVERRMVPRQPAKTIDEKAAFSRLAGRAGEFFSLIALGAAAAILIADAVRTILFGPLAQIASHL